jgi:V8-like Glu-specific endopeptidase
MYASHRLTLVLALACATSAFAQDVAKSTPIAGASHIAVSEAETKAAQEYWTPERLANARPMPLQKVSQATMSPSAAPATRATAEPLHFVPGGLPAVKLQGPTEASPERFPLNQGPDVEVRADATPSPDGFNYEMPFNNFRTGNTNAYPYSTIGKLFFTIPPGASEAPGDYVCSAAVAVDKHTVVTARHCTYDPVNLVFYNNWVFYPGWNNGSDGALGGAWYINFAYTWTTGVPSLTGGYDIALLSMHDNTGTGCGGDKGHTIGYYVGWLGYTYGGDFYQRQWNIFGYPQGAPFEGNYRYQDNAATGAFDPFGSNFVVEAGNPQTGGTSGGPWIIGFDPSNAPVPNPNNNTNPGFVNLINGVNSFIWTDPSEPLALNGTVFFQSNFWNLYTKYQTVACR